MELGISEVEIETTHQTVLDTLRTVEKKIGKSFLDDLIDCDRGLVKGTIILLNGRNIVHLEGLNSKTGSGDEINIFPPGGGG